jgi:hypothetical protein
MNPQQLTNEQFALWLSSQVGNADLINNAEALYKWLESKKQKQTEIKNS